MTQSNSLPFSYRPFVVVEKGHFHDIFIANISIANKNEIGSEGKKAVT